MTRNSEHFCRFMQLVLPFRSQGLEWPVVWGQFVCCALGDWADPGLPIVSYTEKTKADFLAQSTKLIGLIKAFFVGRFNRSGLGILFD